MIKFRAVLMVPTVVEFENPVGSNDSVTDQANRIAKSRGKALSLIRDHTYVPSNLDLAEETKKPL
jgi:hypothetical protein